MKHNFNKFIDKSFELKKAIDEKSLAIKKCEELLIETGLSFKFRYLCEGREGQSYWLVWDYYAHQDKYRLLAEITESDEVVLCKPLIESKLETRLILEPFLTKFMDSFSIELDEWRLRNI